MIVKRMARECMEHMPLLKAPKAGFGEAEKTGQAHSFCLPIVRRGSHYSAQCALTGRFQHRWRVSRIPALDLPRFGGAYPRIDVGSAPQE